MTTVEALVSRPAGSHSDIGIRISINVSIRKIRKICMNRGYMSINISISRNGTFSISF